MFTIFMEFRKDTLKNFTELEVESVANALNIISQSVNADVCFDVQFGADFVKVFVLLRATEIVDFLATREGIELNLTGRGFVFKDAKIENTSEDESVTDELLLNGVIEKQMAVKVGLLKKVVSKLLKKG